MARELGMNPRKLGSLADRRQEPWKLPLAEFIVECYRKSFGRSEPEHVRTLEEVVRAEERRRKEKQARKAEKHVRAEEDPNDLETPDLLIQRQFETSDVGRTNLDSSKRILANADSN